MEHARRRFPKPKSLQYTVLASGNNKQKHSFRLSSVHFPLFIRILYVVRYSFQWRHACLYTWTVWRDGRQADDIRYSTAPWEGGQRNVLWCIIVTNISYPPYLHKVLDIYCFNSHTLKQTHIHTHTPTTHTHKHIHTPHSHTHTTHTHTHTHSHKLSLFLTHTHTPHTLTQTHTHPYTHTPTHNHTLTHTNSHHTHNHTNSHSHKHTTHTHTHPHTITHSHTQTHTHTNSHSHKLTLTQTHTTSTHTHTPTHTTHTSPCNKHVHYISKFVGKCFLPDLHCEDYK